MEEQKKNKTLKKFEYLIMFGICLILYICIMELFDGSRLYFWRSIFLVAPLTYIIYFYYESILLEDSWNAISRSNQIYKEQKQKEYDELRARVEEYEDQIKAIKKASKSYYNESIDMRSALEHEKKRAQREYEEKQLRLKALQEEKESNFAETGYMELDSERAQREYEEKQLRLKALQEEKESNYAETGYMELDSERAQRENEVEQSSRKFIERDNERIQNFKKFGKELTNKEILDEFEKQNIFLDFKTKTRIENQLNGLVRISELPYEIDVIRKKQFKYLNDIGVWYDINGRRIVKFPKSEIFWKDAGGRDGSRGIDDWTSK